MLQKAHVYDISEAEFEQRVLMRSREVIVVVDFWAPWCGPCKTLGPILEALATEFKGRFELVKVNIDESPNLAQAMRIQSIPLVYAFKDGRPLDGFQGALPAAQVRAFIEKIVPAPQKSALETGQAALLAGNLPAAQTAFDRALKEKPGSAEALIGLARVALARRDTAAATKYLDQVAKDDPAYAQAERLRGVMGFSADAGDVPTLRAQVEKNPKDFAAWYALGATLASQGDLEAAFEPFLEVVRLDRAFRDDGGRKALLALFDLMGHEDPRVIAARRRLSALLF